MRWADVDAPAMAQAIRIGAFNDDGKLDDEFVLDPATKLTALE